MPSVVLLFLSSDLAMHTRHAPLLPPPIPMLGIARWPPCSSTGNKRARSGLFEAFRNRTKSSSREREKAWLDRKGRRRLHSRREKRNSNDDAQNPFLPSLSLSQKPKKKTQKKNSRTSSSSPPRAPAPRSSPSSRPGSTSPWPSASLSSTPSWPTSSRPKTSSTPASCPSSPSSPPLPSCSTRRAASCTRRRSATSWWPRRRGCLRRSRS